MKQTLVGTRKKTTAENAKRITSFFKFFLSYYFIILKILF